MRLAGLLLELWIRKATRRVPGTDRTFRGGCKQRMSSSRNRVSSWRRTFSPRSRRNILEGADRLAPRRAKVGRRAASLRRE